MRGTIAAPPRRVNDTEHPNGLRGLGDRYIDGRIVKRSMNFGIDTHGAEREGEGNSTYTRNLCRSLLALDGEDTFTLFAGEPGHSFYRSLGAAAGLRVRAVAQHGGFGRIVWALARAAAQDSSSPSSGRS